MASHKNTAQARRNIGTESAGYPSPITQRNAAGEYATTIGDHQFSRLICARVPCARNGGKIEAGFHSWRSLPPPACPPNGFHSEEPEGNWVLVLLFFRPRVRGSQGTNRIDLRHHRQTRFGYARSKRSQPQFKAHNSVRPFENGLRLRGSSATRPRDSTPSHRELITSLAAILRFGVQVLLLLTWPCEVPFHCY